MTDYNLSYPQEEDLVKFCVRETMTGVIESWAPKKVGFSQEGFTATGSYGAIEILLFYGNLFTIEYSTAGDTGYKFYAYVRRGLMPGLFDSMKNFFSLLKRRDHLESARKVYRLFEEKKPRL